MFKGAGFACVLHCCSAAWGATLTDVAYGFQMAGSTVTVTRYGGSMSSATLASSGTGALAVALGSGGFTLTVSPGDTFFATWTLTNTDPASILFNRITAVSIDLTLSDISLFDSGSAPSTAGSGPGIPGASGLSGVGIAASSHLLPWPDPSNLGDMYRAMSIEFSGAGLTSGLSSSWAADSDVLGVPEPGTFGPAACGFAVALLGATVARNGRRTMKRYAPSLAVA